MKFPNAILSIATATLGSVSNNNNVADAKLWPLRGLGKESPQQQPRDGSSIVESLLHEEEEDLLPTPTANLHQGERRLPKKDRKNKKNKGGEKKDEADDEEEKAPKKKKKDKGTDTGTEKDEGKKGKGKRGKKVEKIGEEILVEAPNDVIAKADCYDDFEVEGGGDDDVSVSVRRILKKSGTKGDKNKKKEGEKKVKTKGTKNGKQELISGTCESFATDEDPTEEEVEVAGDDIAVETTDNHTCDPDDDETPCEEEEEEGVGEDPTILPPVDEKGVEVDMTMEEEDASLFSRHLTGDTNHIGDFAPLSCNPAEFDCSGAAGLSSVMGGGEVVVPCGTCLVVSVT